MSRHSAAAPRSVRSRWSENAKPSRSARVCGASPRGWDLRLIAQSSCAPGRRCFRPRRLSCFRAAAALRLTWSRCWVLGMVPGVLEAVISGLFDADAFELGLRERFQALENVHA